jgi:ribosomal-protein-alanine N-acetyltransferase
MNVSEIIQSVLFQLPAPTERLTLRKFCEGDREGFITFMTDDSSTRWLAFTDEQKTATGANVLFDEIIQEYDTDRPVGMITVEDSESKQWAGFVGCSAYGNREYEVYYGIAQGFRQRGFAYEATCLLMELMPDTLDVLAWCDPENLPSQRVVQKMGFNNEGLRPHNLTNKIGLCFARRAAEPNEDICDDDQRP